MSSPPASVPLNRPLITVAIMMATIMQTLDSTIANVALPHMQGSLSASQDEIIWVLTSYIVAAAIATPLTGWLSGRFGVSQLLCSAIVGFTAASVMCGIATSLDELIAARVLQGIWGAVLVPLSQTILLGINPKEKHGQAMALWGVGVMVGPILGPTLGGWLTESYNWRWVFFVNVPIGMLALAGVLTGLPKGKPLPAITFDFLGFATLALAIGSLQLLLDRGEQLDWMGSIEIRVEAIIALLSFLVFVIHTSTYENAFFKIELLHDRNFLTGVSFTFITGAILYATRALLAPMLQNLMGYDAFNAGLVTAPSGAGTMLAMLIVGRLVGRIDTRILISSGILISAFASYQMCGYTLEISKSDIIWPGVIQGFGLGFMFVPLSTTTFASLRAAMRTDGAAIYSLSRNIGSSIGISSVQSMVTHTTQVMHSSLVEHINLTNPALSGHLNASTPAAAALLNSIITQQAAMVGYLNVFKLMFIVMLAVTPLVLLFKKPSAAAAAENAHIALE